MIIQLLNWAMLPVLKCLCSNHLQQIIIGHMNINSIRNKLDIVKPMLLDEIDIFIVTETKLDDSCQASRLIMKVFARHLD